MVYVTLTICGLPASCPVAHVGSLVQASTVTVLVNVPTPSVAGAAGLTGAWPLGGVMITLETDNIAGLDGRMTMYKVPLPPLPVTVPVTVCDAGVAAIWFAAE